MKLFEKGELKILWPFYLEAFLSTIFYIASPFMVLYFLSIGLQAWQVGIIMAASPLAYFLFEIPTGAIADLYGRKFSVILGCALAGTFYIFIAFVHSFLTILALMFVMSAAFTLSSGSYEAWVVDLLKSKKKKLVSEFFSRRQSFLSLAFIFAGVIGALLVAKFGLIVIWPVSGVTFFLSVVILSFGEERYVRRKVHIKESFNALVKQTKISFSYAYRHHVLFYLFGIIFIWGILMTLTSQLSLTPFLKGFGMPDSWFGYFWSATGVLGVVAPLLSMKLAKKYNTKSLLMIAPFAFLFFGIAALLSTNLFFALSIILFFYLVVDFDGPLFNTYFHKHAPTKMRATLGSIHSMLGSFAAVIGTLFAGFLVSSIGAKYAIFIGGLFMIPTIILYLRIKEKK